MADRRKDLPTSTSPNFLLQVREAMSTYLGTRGDKLDRGVTVRDLVDSGLVELNPGYLTRGGSPIKGPGSGIGGDTTVIVNPGGPGTDPYEPDLTPPPVPSGVIVGAGFSTLIIQTDPTTYTVGHGHARTQLFGATWVSGPKPTFADAVLIGEYLGNIFSHPTTLGTEWHLWLKWVTVDGVVSPTPAGGTNGFEVATGRVGSSDLAAASVLAQALAPGSVTAEKAALDIGGDNLMANNSFDIDTDGDGVGDGWAIYAFNESPVASRTPGRISGFAQRVTWSGVNTSFKGFTQSNVANPQWGVRGGWAAGKTYVVSFYARADGAKASGCELQWPTQAPATQTALKNPNLTGSWQRYAWRVVWGGAVEPNARLRFGGQSLAPISGWIEFDDVQVEEGDMLSGYQGKLATNTIVAGDGAIANLAITNALIANLAVDDAKVSNLSVAKLLAGSLAVGQYIQSSNFVTGVSGWKILSNGQAEFSAAVIRDKVVANQIDGRNLEIKDSFGNVILAAGQAMSWGYVSSASRPRMLVAASKGYTNTTSPLASGSYLDGLNQRGPHWWGFCWYDPTTLTLLDYYEVGPGNGSPDIAADKLEYYLNNGGNQILTVCTDDHPTGLYNARLIAALLRYGASRGGLGSTSFLTTYRAAYALVGRVGLGEGQGIESLSRVSSSYAIASATIMNGQIIGAQRDLKIDISNVTTFIDAAAINAAQIGSLSVGVMSTAMNGGSGIGMQLETNRLDIFDEVSARRCRLGRL